MSKSTSTPDQLQLFDFDTLQPVEIWREIPGYGGRYEASSEGRIRRVLSNASNKASWRGDIRTPYPPDAHGYVRIGVMRNDGTLYRPGVHVLVALAFLGPCPEGREVNHIDLNKSNNRPSNLEYITHAQNMEHASAAGVMSHNRRGHPCAHRLLTDAQALAIRASTLSERELGERYGVSQVSIHNIKAGKTYRYLQKEPR